MRAKLSVWSSFNLTPSSPLRWPLKAMSKLKRLVYWKLENVKKKARSWIIITRQRQGQKIWPTCQLEAHSLLYPMSPRFVGHWVGVLMVFSAGKRPRPKPQKYHSEQTDRLKNFNSQSTTRRILANGPPLCQVKSSRVIVYRLAPSFTFRKPFLYCTLLSVQGKSGRCRGKIQNCRARTNVFSRQPAHGFNNQPISAATRRTLDGWSDGHWSC